MYSQLYSCFESCAKVMNTTCSLWLPRSLYQCWIFAFVYQVFYPVLILVFSIYVFYQVLIFVLSIMYFIYACDMLRKPFEDLCMNTSGSTSCKQARLGLTKFEMTMRTEIEISVQENRSYLSILAHPFIACWNNSHPTLLKLIQTCDLFKSGMTSSPGCEFVVISFHVLPFTAISTCKHWQKNWEGKSTS